MIEVTFRLAEDIEDVSALDIQNQLQALGYHPVSSGEYIVHVHNLDAGDDDPQAYGSVCLDQYGGIQR
jgi:phosphoribosylformylglycinamidine (FGAM) synthase PurS component